MSTPTFEPLTLERAKQLAAEVVADMGAEYVYEPPVAGGFCVYDHEGQPSCLVGHIIHRHSMEMYDDVVRDHSTNDVAGLPLSWFDGGARAFLGRAQHEQDNSAPWGQAVETALDYLEHEDDED